MAWKIEITRTAEKQIKKLAHPAQKTVIRFLRERVQSAENPRKWGKPLRGAKRGLWRYRVELSRLICDIQDEKITALLLAVEHRQDVYR